MTDNSNITIRVPPIRNVTACPGDYLTLLWNITVRTSTVGYCASDQYIGDRQSGRRLEFHELILNDTQNYTVDTFGTLIDAYEVNGSGLTALEIELRCTVSVESIFICGGDGQPGTERNVTLTIGQSRYALYMYLMPMYTPTLWYSITSCTLSCYYCRTTLYYYNTHKYK